MNENLWKFAQQLPCENKFQAVLKSALFSKSLQAELDPKYHGAMCRKCYIPWREGYFTVVVVPGSRQCEKQIEKYERMGELTKQQKSLLQYLKLRAGRMVKYTCQICSYITRVSLDKGVKRKPAIVTPLLKVNDSASKPLKSIKPQKAPKPNNPPPTTSDKPTRVTDPTAGLKIPAKSPISANSQQVRPGAKQYSSNSTRAPGVNQFRAQDFRAIQQLLAAKVSSEAATKPKTKGPLERMKAVLKQK